MLSPDIGTTLGAPNSAPTHLKAAINDPDERAGDVEAPLNLSDGALHVGSAEGFGEINK